MRENLRPVWLLAKRELRDQFRDWRIIFPLIVLTLLFPLLMNEFAGSAVGFINQYGGDLIVDRLVPFSILIIGFFPITVSLVVALESFVGEKERRTIEPLLSTPFLDWQLYLGKMLVGIFFPLLASYIAVGLYLFMVRNQNLNMPPLSQIIQLLALTASHAVLMVSGAIAVSTQSTSVRAANLLASFIIIPVAILIQGESVLLFWGNGDVLWLAVVAVAIIAVLLVRVGVAHFQREYLLGREIDSLNFRLMWRTFKDQFVGDAHSLSTWYRTEVGSVLKKLSMPMTLLIIIMFIAGVAGFNVTAANLPAVIAEIPEDEMDTVLDQFQAAIGLGGEEIEITYGLIFGHNTQAVFATLLLGIFSLGVLGVLVFMLNMGVVGAALALFQTMGFSAWRIFLLGILPHGILEIPAIMLASAGVLYLGAILVTPNPSKTMGEVFLRGLADWFKIAVGLVIPLLAIAAAIETYITPLLLVNMLG